MTRISALAGCRVDLHRCPSPETGLEEIVACVVRGSQAAVAYGQQLVAVVIRTVAQGGAAGPLEELLVWY